MVHDRCNYFSFWAIFPFHPPNSSKTQNFIKMKKKPGDIILHMCTKNHDHVLFCSWDMACDRCNCYFSFWEIFCPFTPLTAQKIKILIKWKKTPGDIIILYMCTKNYYQMINSSWDMVHNRHMDIQTNRWEKWHKEVGTPPKKVSVKTN